MCIKMRLVRVTESYDGPALKWVIVQ